MIISHVLCSLTLDLQNITLSVVSTGVPHLDTVCTITLIAATNTMPGFYGQPGLAAGSTVSSILIPECNNARGLFSIQTNNSASIGAFHILSMCIKLNASIAVPAGNSTTFTITRSAGALAPVSIYWRLDPSFAVLPAYWDVIASASYTLNVQLNGPPRSSGPPTLIPSAWFDGASSVLVSAPPPQSLFSALLPFSITFWLAPWSVSSSGVVLFQAAADGSTASSLSVDFGKAIFTLTQMDSASSQPSQLSFAAGVFTVSTWQHYALTFDGSSFLLYVNGLRVICTL